jgi:hypothetical protein
VLVHPLCGAKVAQGCPLSIVEKDVGRLDIAVDQTVVMACSEADERLASEGQDAIGWEGDAKVIFGGTAGRDLRREVANVLEDVSILDVKDVRAFETLEVFRLPKKGGGVWLAMQQLDCHLVLETPVVCEMDLPVVALPEEPEQLVTSRNDSRVVGPIVSWIPCAHSPIVSAP